MELGNSISTTSCFGWYWLALCGIRFHEMMVNETYIKEKENISNRIGKSKKIN